MQWVSLYLMKTWLNLTSNSLDQNSPKSNVQEWGDFEDVQKTPSRVFSGLKLSATNTPACARFLNTTKTISPKYHLKKLR